jgi:hypothetical protein
LFLAACVAARAQTNVPVGFDRDRYDIFPGETFEVEIRLLATVTNGLSSFGVRVTGPATNASVLTPAAIGVAAELDHDGAHGPGAVRSVSNAIAAVKGTVNFYTATPVPFQGDALARFAVTDAGNSPYTLGLDFFNTLGPTEQIFVDGLGTVLDPFVTFGSAFINYRPNVTITAPSNGSTFLSPSSLTVSADASDRDGNIARVEFFAAQQKIGEDTNAPYSVVWSNLVNGLYVLRAVATDNWGASTTSAVVNVSIQTDPRDFYAIFAGEPVQPARRKVIFFKGDRNTVAGKIHSNSDLEVGGQGHGFRNGFISYVTAIYPEPDFGGKVSFDTNLLSRTSFQPYPLDYTLADFAPGGRYAALAQAAGQYFRFTRDLDLMDHATNGVLREGLYFVEGKVKFNEAAVRGRVTIVATGEIDFKSRDAFFESYIDCLLLFSTRQSPNYHQHAVRLAGRSSKWRGIVFAPNGGIHLHSSEKPNEWDGDASGTSASGLVDDQFQSLDLTMLGSLVGRSVRVNAKNFNLTGIGFGDDCPAMISELKPQMLGGRLVLTFPTVLGLRYLIESTDSLAVPRWEVWRISHGDGSTKTFDIPVENVPQRFYRLRLE